MLTRYVKDIANQIGIKLTKVSLVDGQRLGCIDVHLLKLSTRGHNLEKLIYKTDLEMLAQGVDCPRLDIILRSALSQLDQMKHES